MSEKELSGNEYSIGEVAKKLNLPVHTIRFWTETFEHIPLYKLIKAMEGDKNYKFDFKDKIVYFGATVSSLSDIKTVPVD